MAALDLTDNWPVPHVSAAILRAGTVVTTIGDPDRVQRLASISKPMAAWATLVAVEEGVVSLDQPAGQPGCTVRHLLAHAGGYGFDGDEPIARPETTRMYSNTGIGLVARAVEDATGMTFADYLQEAVFDPLGMHSSALRGPAAHGVRSNLADTCRFIGDVMRPTLIHSETAAEAKRIHYPALAGIVPGVGRYEQCPWGLGFEVRGNPDLDLAVVALADRDFDEWAGAALAGWSELSDAVIAEYTDGVGVPA